MILTFSIAIVTGWLAKKLKIPAGALVGGMIGVSVLHVLTESAVVPALSRPILQMAGGAFLGHAISKSDLFNLRKLIRPALLLIMGLIAINMVVGYLLFKLSHLDLTTAMYSAAPGGVSDMALIIEEMNGDTMTVSILQIFRLLSIYLLYPPMFKILAKRFGPKQEQVRGLEAAAQEINIALQAPMRWGRRWTISYKEQTINFLQTLLASVCGGLLLIFLKVPAGGMVGGVLFSGLFNMKTGRGYVPKKFGFFLQAGVGALIGSNMTRDNLLSIRHLIIPIIIMTIALILFTVILGYAMFKLTSLDIITSVLAITPGGIQEMSMIARELGCDTTPVIVMHTVRLVAVICIFPSLIMLLI